MIYNKKYHYELDNDYNNSEGVINKMPERRLWKAVIINAINDALRKPTSKYLTINKENAVNWLLEDDNNFIKVCDMAGISSQLIRSKIKPIIKTN